MKKPRSPKSSLVKELARRSRTVPQPTGGQEKAKKKQELYRLLAFLIDPGRASIVGPARLRSLGFSAGAAAAAHIPSGRGVWRDVAGLLQRGAMGGLARIA